MVIICANFTVRWTIASQTISNKGFGKSWALMTLATFSKQFRFFFIHPVYCHPCILRKKTCRIQLNASSSKWNYRKCNHEEVLQGKSIYVRTLTQSCWEGFSSHRDNRQFSVYLSQAPPSRTCKSLQHHLHEVLRYPQDNPSLSSVFYVNTYIEVSAAVWRVRLLSILLHGGEQPGPVKNFNPGWRISIPDEAFHSLALEISR